MEQKNFNPNENNISKEFQYLFFINVIYILLKADIVKLSYFLKFKDYTTYYQIFFKKLCNLYNDK